MSFPVRIGPVCERLIKKGLLEYEKNFQFITHIKATRLAHTFVCSQSNCRGGSLESVNDEGEVTTDSMCAACNGIGVVEYNNPIQLSETHSDQGNDNDSERRK